MRFNGIRFLGVMGLAALAWAAPAWSQPPLGVVGEDSQRIPVRLVADRTSYRIGDLMRLEVRSERTAHLVLLVTDGQGRTQVIIPGPFSGHETLYAGQTLQIRDNRGRLLRQEGPEGVETVTAVVTREPLDLQKLAPWLGPGRVVADPAGFSAALQEELKARMAASGGRPVHGQADLHYAVEGKAAP